MNYGSSMDGGFTIGDKCDMLKVVGYDIHIYYVGWFINSYLVRYQPSCFLFWMVGAYLTGCVAYLIAGK